MTEYNRAMTLQVSRRTYWIRYSRNDTPDCRHLSYDKWFCWVNYSPIKAEWEVVLTFKEQVEEKKPQKRGKKGTVKKKLGEQSILATEVKRTAFQCQNQ